jgi:outer membrane receptor protein involved in Fe transport
MPAMALAQNSEQATSLEPEIEVQQIVVTARLREENLEDVPLSAHVVARRLQDQNINSLSDLSQVVSGLKFEPTGRSNEQSVRGINSGNNVSFNQSVPVFQDGVYHGRSRTSGAAFLDLDRVEILKGPQSTYFGNNAIGGALSLITRQPGENFNLSVRTLYGNFGQYGVDGAVGGRISNEFSWRAAALVNGQDGYLENAADGSKSPNEDNKAARVSLLYQPSNEFDATLKLEGSKYNQSGGLVQQVDSCPPDARFTTGTFCNQLLTAGLPTGLENDQNSFPSGQGTELDTAEGVLTLNYRLGARLTLTSISAYNTYDYLLKVAGNPTPIAQITAAVPEDFHQVSQELRIATDTEGTFEYLAGLYYLKEDLEFTQDTNYFLLGRTAVPALQPFAPIGQRITGTQPAETYSVFGSAGVRVFENLKFSAGVRGSRVEKDIDRSLLYGTATQTYGGVAVFTDPTLQTAANGLGLGTTTVQSTTRSDDAVTPSAQIQYFIGDSAMSYGSYTRGFKAGGFNAVDTTGNLANLPYDPEYVDAFEIGLKTKWLDGKLTINTAVFHSEYDDLQVAANSFLANGAIINIVQNAASATSQGVELETRWTISPRFQLALEGTYLDATYNNFTTAGSTQAQQVLGIRTQDLSGQDTPLAPSWSGSLVGAYIQPIAGSLQLTTELSVFGSTGYFLGGAGTNDDLLYQPGYGRLDARLALQSGNWVGELVGKNLTDRTIRLAGSAVPATAGTVIESRQAPRSAILQIRYSFN